MHSPDMGKAGAALHCLCCRYREAAITFSTLVPVESWQRREQQEGVGSELGLPSLRLPVRILL